MQIYEISYLILPSIPEDKVSGVANSIKAMILKSGGKEIDSETPILHPLAYEMSKTVGASRYVLSDAYIGWTKFESEPENVVTVKNSVEKMDEVLRFLIVKAPRETTFTFTQALVKAQEKEQKEEIEAMPTPTEEAVVE